MANIHEPHFEIEGDQPGFHYRRAWLGYQAGCERLGVSLWDLSPGLEMDELRYVARVSPARLLLLKRRTDTAATRDDPFARNPALSTVSAPDRAREQRADRSCSLLLRTESGVHAPGADRGTVELGQRTIAVSRRPDFASRAKRGPPRGTAWRPRYRATVRRRFWRSLEGERPGPPLRLPFQPGVVDGRRARTTSSPTPPERSIG
jgi:hypothetical protein